jgi:PAS domain S-box-containing protein
MGRLQEIVRITPAGYAMFDENSPIGFVSFDEQAHVTQMNAAAAKLLGVQPKMFLGMPFPAALDPDEVPKFLRHLHRCRAGLETHISTELKLGKKNLERIPVELSTAPTMGDGGQRFPTAIIDLRRSEQRLQMLLEAKQLAEHLFEFVAYPLVAVNEEFMFQASNSAFREKFHLRPHELPGRSLFDLERVRWQGDNFRRALQRVITHREPMKELMVDCAFDVSGERLTLLVSAMRDVPRPGARPLTLITFEDVTHRRRHEQERETMLAELQEMNLRLEERVRERTSELKTANAQLKTLSQRVIDAQETERRSLARELHDEVGQALTGLNMLLHRASDDAPAKVRAEIREARKVVADLLQRVRQMSLDLRPAVLDDLGLCIAVRSYIDTFSKHTGIHVQFECNDIAEQSISPEVKITAFRAAQESLTNIARHAQTKSASVALRGDSSKLFLEIADAGHGFDPLAHQNGGSGLLGMRERVALAGGQLDLESAPGHGTRLTVQLPLRNTGEETR